MKIRKILVLLLSLTLILSLIVACNNDEQGGEDSADIYYTVTFNSNGGTAVEPKQVKQGSTVDEPPIPTRDGYMFDGWYNGNSKWSFYSGVNENMTLTAKWTKPDSLFEHVPVGDGETTVITKLKQKAEEIRLPTYMGGYRVTAVADGVFSNLSSEDVYKIVIPEGIAEIGAEAFRDCAGIEIVVEGELSSVGEKAFYGCDGLTEIKLGGGITAIGAEAFVSSGLVSVTIPETVKVVDENAFSECTSMKSVFIHDSIESVGDSAFYDTGVEVVYFYGTDETVSDVLENKIFARNDAILDARIYLYSETEPAADTEYDGFWYFNEEGQTRLWK